MEKRLFAMRKSTERTSDDNSDQESSKSSVLSPPPVHLYKVVEPDCDPSETNDESLCLYRVEPEAEDVHTHTIEVDDVVENCEGENRIPVITDSSQETHHSTDRYLVNNADNNKEQ